MSNDTSDPQVAALATLSLLETRLRRIEFLLTGTASATGIPQPASELQSPTSGKETVAGRLQQLSKDLEELRRLKDLPGSVIRDIEYLHALTPEIFADPAPSPRTSLSDQATHIFSSTSLYTETASRLSSLQTLPVPPAEQSAQLVELKPRIESARSKQEALEAQARELRERSVGCLEWWVKFGIVGMGELWSHWEDRVKEAERDVGRIERATKERSGYI